MSITPFKCYLKVKLKIATVHQSNLPSLQIEFQLLWTAHVENIQG